MRKKGGILKKPLLDLQLFQKEFVSVDYSGASSQHGEAFCAAGRCSRVAHLPLREMETWPLPINFQQFPWDSTGNLYLLFKFATNCPSIPKETAAIL